MNVPEKSWIELKSLPMVVVNEDQRPDETGKRLHSPRQNGNAVSLILITSQSLTGFPVVVGNVVEVDRLKPTDYRCPFETVQNTVEMLLSIGGEDESCIAITFLPVSIFDSFPWAGCKFLVGPVGVDFVNCIMQMLSTIHPFEKVFRLNNGLLNGV